MSADQCNGTKLPIQHQSRKIFYRSKQKRKKSQNKRETRETRARGGDGPVRRRRSLPKTCHLQNKCSVLDSAPDGPDDYLRRREAMWNKAPVSPAEKEKSIDFDLFINLFIYFYLFC